MGLTQEQLIERQKYVGASDVACIVGLSPWSSAEDIRLQKTGKVKPRTFSSQAADLGNLLEKPIAIKAASELGVNEEDIEFDVHLVGPVDFMRANLDAVIKDKDNAKNQIIECKTSGLTGPLKYNQWGDAGTDEIPMHYVIQAQWQLAMAGDLVTDTLIVPALLGGKGLVLYHIKRDVELADMLLERVATFWQDNVLKDVPCSDSKASVEILEYMNREEKKEIPIDDQLVATYKTAQAMEKQAVELKREAKAAILESLGDAEIGSFDNGRVTYFLQEKKGYFVEPSEFRVLRVGKAKKESGKK